MLFQPGARRDDELFAVVRHAGGTGAAREEEKREDEARNELTFSNLDAQSFSAVHWNSR